MSLSNIGIALTSALVFIPVATSVLYIKDLIYPQATPRLDLTLTMCSVIVVTKAVEYFNINQI